MATLNNTLRRATGEQLSFLRAAVGECPQRVRKRRSGWRFWAAAAFLKRVRDYILVYTDLYLGSLVLVPFCAF
jgi:hypothetical protein